MRLVIIGLFLLAGCSTSSEKNLKQDLDQIYIGSGVERYYLSDMPSWANFSTVASCKRVEPIRFLHFENMYKSYSMDYEQLIQFQHMLNRKFASYKISTGRKTIFLKDESYIMHNVHQQIIGGGRDFIVPNFNRIHLVWIDQAVKSEEGKKRLKKLMYSAQMEKGHPIFVSTCLSSIEIEKFITKMNMAKFGVKIISQDMFSPFNEKYKIINEYALDFTKLMPNKDIYYFGSHLPKEFKGINNKRVFKY